MASIFLSYARDDAAKAKTLAKALERAGHSVWWDRQIFGGSEFSAEIETALKDADVVIVLWSEAAVRSAWVRDEAAEGRDSGRLVPVMLEGCAPPLGFRQVQSISLAGWQGRGNPPHLQEIFHAVAKRTGKQLPTATGEARVHARRRPLMLALGLFGALLLAVGGWWLLEGRGKASETPVLAVLPFADLSPEGDKAYFAEGVAEAILTVLAKEPGIQVVGRSTARQLHDAGNDAARMRKALGVTHVLEGTARSVGDQLRMSVRLVDAKDGQQLWAEEYRRRLDNVFAVQDEIGRAVAQRLKGSFTAGPAARQLTTTDAYILYLAARAKMRDRRISSLREALGMARQVISADPDYAPGHALYAELVWLMSFDGYGTMAIEKARDIAAPHARRAIQLAPNSPEGHAAFGLVWTGEEAVQSLQRAIELDPGRAELRVWLARTFEKVARNEEALDQFKAAVEIDPLLGPAVWNYSFWLAASRRFDEAELAVREFERRGGSRATAASVRAQIAGFFRGDYSEAARQLMLTLEIDPEAPVAKDYMAIIYEKLGLYDRAARLSTNLPRYTRLFNAGDIDGLSSQARKQGAKVWSEADPSVALNGLALRRDWSTIVKLYDQHPNRPAVCNIVSIWEVQLAVDLATALQARGRSADATAMLNCLKRSIARQDKTPARSGFLPVAALDLARAQAYALEALPAQAFAQLRRAIAGGMRTSYGRGLSELPAFDRYRSLPEYRVLDTRLKQLIAQDRAELLRIRPELRRAA